jgi:hypothetical protein
MEETNIKSIMEELNKSMKKRHGNHEYEEGFIIKDLDEDILAEIADTYILEGWNYVYYRINKEDIDYNPLVRPTCQFLLSNKELEDKWEFTQVSK